MARDRGAVVATGGCIPLQGEGLPYAPITGIIRDLVQQLGEGAAQHLGPLASGLGLELDVDRPHTPVHGYPGVPHLLDELAKTRLFESVLVGLQRLAEVSTLLLVFEDLQWADSVQRRAPQLPDPQPRNARVLLVGSLPQRRARP